MDSIWERIKLEERRTRAAKLGVKVSDLEELEELQETLVESAHDVQAAAQTDNSNDERMTRVQQGGPKGNPLSSEAATDTNAQDELEEDYDSQYFDKNSVLFRRLAKTRPDPTADGYAGTASTIDGREGGRWHTLPQEIVDRILMILGDIDMTGYLCIVSRTTFRPSETVYQYLCAITYPMQTTRRTLQVENWLNWRNMLIHRPRLRTNGFYTLRTKYSKGYCNDNFWEEKQFSSIEVKFYRHMRFFDHGRVLYSLDIVEPVEMSKLLQAGVAVPKRIFEGRYTMARREVVVEVPLHYCNMRFEMLLLDGDDGYQGKWNMLRLTSHSSTPLPRLPTGQGQNQTQTQVHNQHHHQGHYPNQHQHQHQHNQPSLPTHQPHTGHQHGQGLGQGQPGQGQTVPMPQPALVAQNVNRVEYSLPVVADLRFHRFWQFSGKQHTYAQQSAVKF